MKQDPWKDLRDLVAEKNPYTVEITKARYGDLLKKERLLSALFDTGVEEWSRYGEAAELVKDDYYR